MTNPLRWTALAALLLAASPALAALGDAKPDATALARVIDQHLDAKLAAEKVTPGPQADDAEFLRRVYLDITGVIPSADKAAAFLDSKDPNKRAKLIDELLASPAYGRHMADLWQALLVKHDPDNRGLQFDPLVKWLEAGFNENKSWNKLVSDILTASGEQDEKNGAVTFWLSNRTPDKVTDTVSRVFLGVHLQCAQCHNHPFTKWKQTEYWGMAAFFMKVQATNPRQAVRQGNTLEVSESNAPRRGKGAALPESAKLVPAKFFQGEEPKMKASEPYRPVLAAWLTSADNPFFARALVNRVWGQFFAHGIVNPVDDIQDANPASHPELLQELSARFAADGFDVKNLIRAVCNSQAYQRTSRPADEGAEVDARLFARMAIKAMTPEQMFDSLEQVLGRQKRDEGARGKALQRFGPQGARGQFVAFFQADENADPTEYQAGIPQALRLMNSGMMNNDNVLRELVKAGDAPEKVIERFYLTTLSRRPSAEESQKLLAYVEKHDMRKAYGDIFWALLNSSEFTLNH
jgi:hypothetical protein